MANNTKQALILLSIANASTRFIDLLPDLDPDLVSIASRGGLETTLQCVLNAIADYRERAAYAALIPKSHQPIQTPMPKNNRLKPEADIATRAEFETVLDNIANAQLVRDAMVLERDNELLQIREEFDPKINALNERMNALLLRAERFAVVHRDELFGKLKSSATALTTYGFRLGNPILKLLNRKWSWESVLAALKVNAGPDFIIVKEAPDKDAMKAHLTEVQLANVGCRIDQAEAFFVEPKRDAPADQRLLGAGKGVAA